MPHAPPDTPAPPPALSPPAERLHGLDACRAVAMLLGVFVHAAIPYQTHGGGGWAFDDPAESAWITAAIHVLHSFRMPLFFLLAGFFAALLVERRGVRGLLVNRGARLGVPLLLGMLTISPLCGLAWAIAAGELEHVTPAGLAREVTGFWHLWFLRDLLVLVAACGLVAWAVPRRWLRAAGDRVAAAVLHPLGGVPAAAVLIGWTLLLHPWWGLRDPGAWPRWENLLHHGLWFGVGACLWPHRGRLRATLGRRWAWLAAFGGVAAGANLWVAERMFALGGFELGSPGEEPRWLGLAARGTYALMAAALVLAFVGAFVRHASRPNTAARYVSDASYWAYLIHFPLVVAAGRAAAGLAVPPEAKVLLVLGAVCPVLLVTYALLVRRTLIGRILNGPARVTQRAAGRGPRGGAAAV